MRKANCGTLSGYRAHERHRDAPCEGCIMAKRAYQRQLRLRHLEKSQKRDREYASLHREERKIWAANFYKKNSESLKARSAKNRLDNPSYSIQYRAAHPEIMAKHQRNYRARKRNAPSELYTTQQILDIYGSDCHICLEPIDLTAPRINHQFGWQKGLHLDHVIPISKGGEDMISNIKPSHAVCNLRKHATIRQSA